MEQRRYKTAFLLAKIDEIFGWIVLLAGGLAGFNLLFSDNQYSIFGVVIIIFAGVMGLVLIFSAQAVLIIIDTENNTRRTYEEIEKTNAMLSETLGILVVKVSKLAERER